MDAEKVVWREQGSLCET